MQLLFMIFALVALKIMWKEPVSARSMRQGKDFALFFAVNDYQYDKGLIRWSDLNGPINDARDIANDLKDLYGFETEVVENPTLLQIFAKLDEYSKMEFTSDAQLFVFFSGHGSFMKGEGFFIPSDGKTSPEDRTQATWFSLLRLRRQINDLPCRHIILVIDACYSGTLDDNLALKGPGDDGFGRPGEDVNQRENYIKDLLRAKSRLYFTSGGAERTPDPSGFAAQLKAALRNHGGSDGLLTPSDLEDYLLAGNVDPRPRFGFFEGHEPGGKFVFVYHQIAVQPTKEELARDRKDWEKAKKADKLSAYRQYEKEHPNGDFIILARQKIELLDEEGAWLKAKNTNDVKGYQDFIKLFPKSAYSEPAKEKVRELLRLNSQDKLVKSVFPERIDDPLVGVMMLVSGGTFLMGCTPEQNDCEKDENPVHTVALSDYYIGQTEVTQAQWRAVMGSDPPGLGFPGCDFCPVEGISWNEIQVFLSVLNKKSNVQYRLPTEAEWEYAARGGLKRKQNIFAGSEILDEVAWHVANSEKKTHIVKGKKPNAIGLYDMSGNVWEWCSNWYSAYPETKVVNPAGPDIGSHRVFRGGSWSNKSAAIRLTNRNYWTPISKYNDLGFRLARPVGN